MVDLNNPVPLIFAHRGASTLAPENTLSALREAIAMGADGVEFDVHLSGDKVPVLFHDSSLRALTTTYHSIHSTPFAALQSLRVGAPEFNERIPSLDDALRMLSDSSLRINIELKSQPYWHTGLEQRVIALIDKYDLQERVTLSSFSPISLVRCAIHGRNIARGLLVHPKAFFPLLTVFTAKLAQVRSVHISTQHVASALATRVEQSHYHMWVWTANSAEHIHAAQALGAEAIISDDPRTARAHMRNYHDV